MARALEIFEKLTADGRPQTDGRQSSVAGRVETMLTPYEKFGEPNPQPDAYLEEVTFRAGDTLSGIAHRYLGDWHLWRTIADRNSIVDVRTSAPGTRLLIPPAPLEKGRYEST